MLIGDAANQADPLNRGGIHTAMESAFCAFEACQRALSSGDFSRRSLSLYEALWSSQSEPDWRASELFMSVAKNPRLKDLSLFLLDQVGKLTAADPQFGAFASGVFSGVVSPGDWLTPHALYQAFPKDPQSWLTLLRSNSKASNLGTAAGALRLVSSALANAATAGAGLARSPGTSLDWGMDVITKALRLAERQMAGSSGTSVY
jgi:hypothetical protein